jgi:hypothetical protein
MLRNLLLEEINKFEFLHFLQKSLSLGKMALSRIRHEEKIYNLSKLSSQKVTSISTVFGRLLFFKIAKIPKGNMKVGRF